MMFTAEIEDRAKRREDGPHHTLRWRKKVRIAAMMKNDPDSA